MSIQHTTTSTLRILIVEDETLVARDLCAALVRGGYEVCGLCRTGQEALDTVQLQRPDLVLMDIQIEGPLDGIETATRLQREHGRPVVFLTAFADDTTTARARTAQPYGYLLKPFHESELRSVVELAVTRFQADQRLRASEERFMSTLRSMADGVISTDIFGTINFINPAAEKLTGWSMPDATGRPLHEVFRVHLPDGGPLETTGLVQQSGKLLRTIMLTDKDGMQIPIEDNTAPIRDPDGALTGIVVLFRKKTADTTLPIFADPNGQAPWPNLAGIVSSISDPIVAVDAQWRITYLNGLGATTLESPREALLGRIFWDCLPASMHRLYYHEFSTAQTRRTARSFEMEHETRNAWYEVQLYPFGDGLLALLRDITTRKAGEEQRLRMEKLESLGLLARGFAHDFNNILTVLMGNLALVDMNTPPDAPVRPELRTARQATTQAQGLVQQLLTFAKGGAPIRQSTNLARLIQEWFAEWTRRPGLDYRLAVSGDDWTANIDRHQIRRMFSNIMRNAEQAASTNGIISIRLLHPRTSGLTIIDLGLPENADLTQWIVIEFIDNGEGIPTENLTRVFEPYFTTRATANASGLGLTVCESIARGHDGTVRLISKHGEGTRVRIVLPAEEKSTSKATFPEATPPPAAVRTPGSRRVLILEDEPLIRQLMVQNLKAAQCHVIDTHDGSETVSRYQEALTAGTPFDLVIMDLSIPGGMGGATAMELIRQMDPSVRAIVSSGYSDDPIMSRFLDYGFRAVLPKPYQPQELRTLVEELLAED